MSTLAAIARRALLVFATVAFPTGAASADPVRDITPAIAKPAVVRGGVLMLPLTAAQAGSGWPRTLGIDIGAGRTVTGTVAWLAPAPEQHRRRGWTGSGGNLIVRPVRSTDDTGQAGSGQPVLLARLPLDATALSVAGRALDPTWHDAPPAPDADVLLPAEPLRSGPDAPDPTDPFAHWRWVLIAEAAGRRPPALDRFAPEAALVAEHYAQLWRAGLTRLERAEPELARACRRDLVLRVRDSELRVAAWTSNPQALAALLAGILDTRQDSAVISAARTWLAMRPRLLVWMESTDDRAVRLAAINRTGALIAPRIEWSDGDELPVAVEIEPGVLTRVTIERPDLPDDLVPSVRLIDDDGTTTIAVGPARLAPRPPGLTFSRARPPLSLADVESGVQRPAPPARATSIELRRRAGRWEVFVECMRTTPAPAADDPLASATNWRDVAGIEAVTLQFGAPDRPTAVLAIPETGWHRLLAGINDGSLQVHRGRYADRWYARVTVPEGWIARDADGVPELRLGAARTHGDGDAAETLPFTSAPWRQAPGSVVARLDRWPR